jgi:hypothetical protein
MQENYRPPERAPLQWYPAPASPPAHDAGRGGRGLAITALVLSAVALLAVVAVAFWVLIATAPADDTGTSGPLTGQLSASAGGGQVTGDTLARAVSARITQDGGEVSRMDCPETPRVGQGIVTVCHGVISLSDYAVVVYFEDEDGHFTLEPL